MPLDTHITTLNSEHTWTTHTWPQQPLEIPLVTNHPHSPEHPSSIEAKNETSCGFRDLTPEEKQRVKRFYAQRGRKHRLSSGFPNEERSR